MFFTCIDPYLGRLEPVNMSQQALMECLVTNLDKHTRMHFCDQNDNFIDFQQWVGVGWNIDEQVIKIEWALLRGTMDLQWLPQTVREVRIESCSHLHCKVDFTIFPPALRVFHLEGQYITGNIHLHALPMNLEEIRMKFCSLEGTIKLESIPQSLELLYIENNNTAISEIDLKSNSETLREIQIFYGLVEGTLDFVDSPPRLVYINLSMNDIGGTLRFTGLAQSVKKLILNGNLFCGELDLAELPHSLESLHLHANNFSQLMQNTSLPGNLKTLHLERCSMSGTVDFAHFPESLGAISIASNQLHGSVTLNHLTNAFDINGQKNQLEGILNLSELSETVSWLYLGENKLAGSLHFPAMPRNMQILSLHTNAFSGTVDFGQLPSKLQKLYLQNNQLSGRFQHFYLPETLKELDISNNQFMLRVTALSAHNAIRKPCIKFKRNSEL